MPGLCSRPRRPVISQCEHRPEGLRRGRLRRTPRAPTGQGPCDHPGCPAWAWIRTGAAFTRAQPHRSLPRALPPWLRPSGPPAKPKLPTQGGALTAADGPRAEHGSCRDGGHRLQQAGPPARRLDAGWSGWGWGGRARPSLGETSSLLNADTSAGAPLPAPLPLGHLP